MNSTRLEFTENQGVHKANRLPNRNVAVTILVSIWLALTLSFLVFGIFKVILPGNFGSSIIIAFILVNLFFLIGGATVIFWNYWCIEYIEIDMHSVRFVRTLFSSKEKFHSSLQNVTKVEFVIPQPQRSLNTDYTFLGLGKWSAKIVGLSGTNYLMTKLTSEEANKLVAWLNDRGISARKS